MEAEARAKLIEEMQEQHGLIHSKNKCIEIISQISPADKAIEKIEHVQTETQLIEALNTMHYYLKKFLVFEWDREKKRRNKILSIIDQINSLA